ncbi:hypothetical protein M404DRAFT_20030 [Pisolithus tinctorius Marx 270]|uniref:DUF6570 domain-containing protein n=1 Tax=Pisolithus tinctorius Marx 270 TaxID=870435 RepID=A0A0C3PEF3_PISTI|nr:hypothetical protein M404DRAFT_20030 [Pisolithus tinctorius Marx 270]
MAGNVTLYEINVPAIVEMLEGRLLPQTIQMLSSILAITLVGMKQLLKDWLSHTFRVRRDVVLDALKWLQANNENYSNVTISQERILTLPEDGIPAEIEATIRYQDSEDAAIQEREGYTMNEYMAYEELDDTNDSPMVDKERDQTTDVNKGDGDVASKYIGDVMPLHILGVADVKQTLWDTTSG